MTVPTFTPPPISDNDMSSSFLDGLKTFNNTFTTGAFIVGEGNTNSGGLKTMDYILIFGAMFGGVLLARAL